MLLRDTSDSTLTCFQSITPSHSLQSLHYTRRRQMRRVVICEEVIATYCAHLQHLQRPSVYQGNLTRDYWSISRVQRTGLWLIPAAKIVAKGMFLHVSVILSTGGSPGRPLPPGQGEPPRSGRPPGQGDPPDQADTPRSGRPPLDQADTPRDQADTPPGKKTAAYGQWAAGTHPPGMHSCITVNLQLQWSVADVAPIISPPFLPYMAIHPIL